jgi:tetratricopeptide (TPR) repeat protein
LGLISGRSRTIILNQENHMAEKSINEISRDARVLFTKANEALQRENVDYAIALFNQVLEKEPAFFECRKVLRATQFRKAGDKGGGFFKKMLSGAGSSPQIAKAKVALLKNAAEAMVIAEQVLNGDPNNSAAHRIIVDAAGTLELPQTAVMSYDIMVKNSPKDKSLAIEYAQAVGTAGGDTSQAERVLAEFLRNSPNDGELNQALKDLSARKTLDQGGYNALESGQGSYRDILKDKQQAASLEPDQRVHKTEDVAERLIGEYETRLKTEPNNLKIARELAKLYAEKKRFDKAFAFFDRIKNSEMGNDPSLERAIADTYVRRFDYQLEQLDPAAQDYAEQSAKIREEKLNFQVADCQKRVEKYPTDLAIKFEMGQLYFEIGKITEAIQEFQKAQQNPHKRLAAMSYLAQCYAKRKMFDLAARTLQNAIKEKVGFDEEKKDLVYNLGCVLESMGKKEEAIEQLKLIYEMDIGYKDVAAKVDAFYAGQ